MTKRQTTIRIDGIDIKNNPEIDQYQVADRLQADLEGLNSYIDLNCDDFEIEGKPVQNETVILNREQIEMFDLETLIAAWDLVDNENPTLTNEQRRIVAREMQVRLKKLIGE